MYAIRSYYVALQINNWNEERKNQSLEQDYLVALQEDLISDSINVEIVRRSRITSYNVCYTKLLRLVFKGGIFGTGLSPGKVGL